jgi:thioredoxin 1
VIINNFKEKKMTASTTDKSFEQDVLKASKLVLVDFWAEWCGPCRQLAPVLEELSSELEGKVEIFKVDIDQNTETPTKYGVRGIPTLIMFKDGKQIATKVGALPKSSLKEWIESNI